MLNSSLDFDQRLSGHVHIVKLNHSYKFGLFDSFSQSDPADVDADIDSRLFYLLFHNAPLKREEPL